MSGNRRHGFAQGIGHGFKPQSWYCAGCDRMHPGKTTRWEGLDRKSYCTREYDKLLSKRTESTP